MAEQQQLTAEQIHEDVLTMRSTIASQPMKIELGRQQRAVIEAAQHAAAGFDSGPLVEFQGLPVVKSRREDHVRLLGEGDEGEDVELEPVQVATPSGPDAPAVESQASA